MEKLVLIDGNSLINRAYYAINPLSNSKGEPTNAIFGFVNMLLHIIQEDKPNYILVAFDRREPTFRHKMYDDYKGNRKGMPEDLAPQLPMLKELLTSLGIAIYDKSGFEADDIIGTMANKFKLKSIVITGDRDSYQLVNENVEVHFTKRGITDIELLNNTNFKEKIGIEPKEIIDLKALMGDSSDNYPGIPGIGEKSALTMVQKYSSVENVYEHIDDFTGKTKEKIINGKDLAFLSKTLATIKTDVEIDLNLEDLKYEFPFKAECRKLFSDLEFKNIVLKDELFQVEKKDIKKESVKIEKIEKAEDLKRVLSLANKICLYVDSNIHIYIENDKEYNVYISETFLDDGINMEEAYAIMGEYLGKEENEIVTFSLKSLKRYLKDFGIEVKCKFQDVDILKYLVDFNGKNSLEDVLVFYGLNKDEIAYSMYLLYKEYIEKVKEQKLEELYSIELKLSNVLSSMEDEGFKIDFDILNKIGEELKSECDKRNEEINELAGEPVNPNSPKQLGILLFEKLNVGKGKKTKTGNYSTDAEVLEKLKNAHPIVPKILRYRSVSKLYSTYIMGLKDEANKDGMIHTIFNQTLTTTGRLSSKEPNLQNIPIRDEEGKSLRKFFVPREKGNVLVDADYSQIELRLLAHFSKCQELINAYKEGKDIHAITASEVFNVPLNEVTPKMRSEAKAVNFGIIYGISEYGLASQLGISPKEAKSYIDKYFESYPKVKEYMESNVNFARDNGYVYTLLGRRRYIREINSPNFNLRSFGERVAYNMPLQGTSADIIKIAMVNVYERMIKEGLKAKLILQVHDELLIDCPKEEKEIVRRILKEEMEGAVSLDVPLVVEVQDGENWYDAK